MSLTRALLALCPMPGPIGVRLAAALARVNARGGGVVLAVQPTAGGRQLYDPGTGAEYSIQSGGPYDGCYIDSNGDPLTAERGYVPGQSVGDVRMYTAHGVEVGTVVGSPASGRRIGYDTISDADYAQIALSSDAYSIVCRIDVATALLGSIVVGIGSGLRWTFFAQAGVLYSRIYNGGTPVVDSQIATAAIGSGTVYLAGTVDGADRSTAVYAWDSDGTLLASDVDPRSGAAVSMAGDYRIGRALGTGLALADPLVWGVGVDGAALTQAQAGAIVEAMRLGGSIDALPGYSLPTDGLTSGVVDLSDLTALPYIGAEGDSTPVAVVEIRP